jgi:hypothetical protein
MQLMSAVFFTWYELQLRAATAEEPPPPPPPVRMLAVEPRTIVVKGSSDAGRASVGGEQRNQSVDVRAQSTSPLSVVSEIEVDSPMDALPVFPMPSPPLPGANRAARAPRPPTQSLASEANEKVSVPHTHAASMHTEGETGTDPWGQYWRLRMRVCGSCRAT